MAEFSQTIEMKLLEHQILCGKLALQALFDPSSQKKEHFKNRRNHQKRQIFNRSNFGLRGSNEAYNTIFPIRI